ncbi:hypothetical protein C8A00DRAFT_41811 [Chaetomidium leptoderma]|uniref:Uncharacterized protein n=1 Tax=Chaetomidium leptoderma TaxID=669021 RepID=A0AAN6VSR5_9PEZI|nr:hypothetical protein C8A00DRAFT_41811 [Chaetomidium leptoderma]
MARIPLAILLLAVLATLASAAVPSFCKCTCFQNSTIIPLGPQHDNNNQQPPPPPPPAKPSSSSSSSSPTTTPTPDDPQTNPSTTNTNPPQSRSRTFSLQQHHLPLAPRESSTSCKQCNRAFCLKYNLPICKDAEEKDIKTSCFQRDSHKDQFIVWCFIVGTAGLLGGAALRRVVDSAKERARRRGLAQQQQQQQQQQGTGMGVGMGMGGGGGVGRNEGGDGRGGGGNNGWRSGMLRRTPSGGRGGGADREVYNPLEDGHDGGAARGPG